MGNPTIFFYGREGGTLEKIDLGEQLSDYFHYVDTVADTQVNGDMEPSTVSWGATHRVRISLQRFDSVQVYNLTRSFERHAQAGLPFGFALDADKCWASFCKAYTIEGGRTSIGTHGSYFLPWGGASSLLLTTDDTICIHSMNPEFNVEYRKVSAYNSTTATVSFAKRTYYDYLEGPVVVRNENFFPVLYLDPDSRGRPIVTSNRGITYNIDIDCMYSPAGMRAFYQDGNGAILNGESDSTDFGTIQEIVGADFSDSSGGVREKWTF